MHSTMSPSDQALTFIGKRKFDHLADLQAGVEEVKNAAPQLMRNGIAC